MQAETCSLVPFGPPMALSTPADSAAAGGLALNKSNVQASSTRPPVAKGGALQKVCALLAFPGLERIPASPIFETARAVPATQRVVLPRKSWNRCRRLWERC